MPSSQKQPAVYKKDFFISYTAADKGWAEWIASQLEDAGYTVVIQAWDFLAGGDFVLEMDKALRECEQMIAVLSEAYFESAFARREWSAGLGKDPAGERGTVLPVRIEQFEIAGLARTSTFVDLADLAESEAQRKLLDEVGARQAGRRRPVSPPPFPGTHVHGGAAFPPSLPPVWNLPMQLRNFVGREDLLDRVKHGLQHRHLVTLFGIGGIGKSRSAVEFAYQSSSDYDAVWRIRARDPGTARADLAALSSSLHLSQVEGAQLNEQIDGVRTWLMQHGRWLLLIDDAPGPQSVSDLLPPVLPGHVIVTSQEAAGWEPLGEPIEMVAFDKTQAIDLLSIRVRKGSMEDLQALAKALGYLPLALEQAAAYMSITGVSPLAYLDRLQERGLEVFAQGQPLDYERTVATTWKIAIEEIGTHAKASRLLNHCAFLSPEGIPRGLFDGGDNRFEISDGDSPRAIDEAISTLRRFSLISVNGEQLSMHRLVQRVVRESFPRRRRRKVVANVRELLVDAWPVSDGREAQDWPACAALAPHLESFARFLRDEEDNSRSASQLLMPIAVFFASRGDLYSAATLFQEVISIADSTPVPFWFFVHTLSEYGVVLTYLDRDGEAMEMHERAIGVIERYRQRNHLQAARHYGLAGISFLEAGELERAQNLDERALDIIRRKAPNDAPYIASALGNLGSVYHARGNPHRARELQLEALALFEQVYGPRHPEVGITLSSLSRAERDLGDLEAARRSGERAQQILAEKYGADSLEVARMTHDLGALNGIGGRYPEARACYEQVIESYQGKFGPDHPLLVKPFKDLAKLCLLAGDPPGALRARKEARRLTRLKKQA